MATVMQAVALPLPADVAWRRQSRASMLTARRFLATILVLSAAGLVLGFRMWVFMLAGLAFAAAILGLRRPRVGLMGAGMLCTLDPLMNAYMFNSRPLPWNTLNYWLLLAGVMLIPLLLRRGDVPFRILQAWAVLLALELLFTTDRGRGVQDLMGISAVLGLVAYATRPRITRADWYWLGVVCGSLSAAGGLLFFLAERASLLDINPNGWVFFPLTALFALCVALQCGWDRPYGRLVVAMLSGISLVWVFLSGSRGGMLMGTACAIYLVVEMRGLRRRATFLVATALLALAAATQFTDLQKEALRRVNLLFDTETPLVDRTSKRSALVLNGWYLFLERPLGVGTGGFADALASMGQRERVTAAGHLHNRPAHAGWIKVLVENGAPGFLLLAAFVGSFAIAGLRRPTRSMRAIGLLAAATLALAFVTTEYQSKGIWFLTAAAIAMLGRGSPLRPRRPARR